MEAHPATFDALVAETSREKCRLFFVESDKTAKAVTNGRKWKERTPNVPLIHTCTQSWGSFIDSNIFEEVECIFHATYLSGLAALNIALLEGYRHIDTLGLDFTPGKYCNQEGICIARFALAKLHAAFDPCKIRRLAKNGGEL